MKTSTADLGFALIVLVVLTLLLVQIPAMGTVARLVPMVVLAFTLGLLITKLIRDGLRTTHWARRRPTPAFTATEPVSVVPESKKHARDSRTERRSGEFQALAWVLGYPLMLIAAGIIPSGVIFTLGYLRFKGNEGWRFSICLTAGLWGAIYLVFVQLLGTGLYAGKLWEMIG